LNFIVSESTILTGEGRDYNLSKEGDNSEHDPGCAILFAVHAHTFKYSGWVTLYLRSELLFNSVNMVSGAFLFIMSNFMVVDVIYYYP